MERSPNGGYSIYFPPHPDFPCPNDEGVLLGAHWHEHTEAGVQEAIKAWNRGAYEALDERHAAGYPVPELPLESFRNILASMPTLHLYCARKEDWKTLFTGLLHDERQRFVPDDALPENCSAGYAPPMVLDFGGQRIYVYPPR